MLLLMKYNLIIVRTCFIHKSKKNIFYFVADVKLILTTSIWEMHKQNIYTRTMFINLKRNNLVVLSILFKLIINQ